MTQNVGVFTNIISRHKMLVSSRHKMLVLSPTSYHQHIFPIVKIFHQMFS